MQWKSILSFILYPVSQKVSIFAFQPYCLGIKVFPSPSSKADYSNTAQEKRLVFDFFQVRNTVFFLKILLDHLALDIFKPKSP